MSKRNWFTMKAAGGVGTIVLYDEIGQSFFGDDAMSAKDFDTALTALGDVKQINLHVNSPGGDVMDGVAIHTMLARHPAKVTAYVDGIAASAASYVVMAADHIIAPENTFMLVHEPRGNGWGTADEMAARAAELGKMGESFAATYAKRSGQTVDAVKAHMKADKMITATEAKALGFVDEISQPVKMAAKFGDAAVMRLPTGARERVRAMMTASQPDNAAATKTAQDEAAALLAAATAPKPATTAAAEPSKVVDINAARDEGTALAQGRAVEIRDLCALAGFPDKAVGYITGDKAVAVIRTELQTAKVEAESKGELRGQHQYGKKGGQASMSVKPEVKASWGKVTNALNQRNGHEAAKA